MKPQAGFVGFDDVDMTADNPLSVISSIGVGDALTFNDRDGDVVRIDRMPSEWHIQHGDKAYVLSDSDHLHSISLIRQYIWRHADGLAFCVLPGQAIVRHIPTRLEIKEAWR